MEVERELLFMHIWNPLINQFALYSYAEHKYIELGSVLRNLLKYSSHLTTFKNIQVVLLLTSKCYKYYKSLP